MLGGLWLGNLVEQHLELRPRVGAESALWDSFGSLLSLNVGMAISRGAFPGIHRFGEELNVRSTVMAEISARLRPSPGPGWQNFLRNMRGPFDGFGGAEAVAPGFGSLRPNFSESASDEILFPKGGTQVFNVGDGDGEGGGRKRPERSTGRNPRVELPAIAPSRPEQQELLLRLTGKGISEVSLRQFLELQKTPMAVAKMEMSKNFGKITMVNRAFRERFGFTDQEASEHWIPYFFNLIDLPSVSARLWLILRGGIFPPSALRWRQKAEVGGEDYTWCIAGGVIREVQGQTYGFGFFEPAADRNAVRDNPAIVRRLAANMEALKDAEGNEEHLRLRMHTFALLDLPASPRNPAAPSSGIASRVVGELSRGRVTASLPVTGLQHSTLLMQLKADLQTGIAEARGMIVHDDTEIHIQSSFPESWLKERSPDVQEALQALGEGLNLRLARRVTVRFQTDSGSMHWNFYWGPRGFEKP